MVVASDSSPLLSSLCVVLSLISGIGAVSTDKPSYSDIFRQLASWVCKFTSEPISLQLSTLFLSACLQLPWVFIEVLCHLIEDVKSVLMFITCWNKGRYVCTMCIYCSPHYIFSSQFAQIPNSCRKGGGGNSIHGGIIWARAQRMVRTAPQFGWLGARYSDLKILFTLLLGQLELRKH